MSSAQFFTTSFGARIAYAVNGAGPPLIFIPPFISHLEIAWKTPFVRQFYELLGETCSVVRYDRFGCGLSDRDRTDFSLEMDVQVLVELIDHLRLRRVMLLGPSSGGPVAVRYAVEHPRRVTHLFLYGMAWEPYEKSRLRGLLQQLILSEPRLGFSADARFYLPDGNAEALDWFTRISSEGASGETMIALEEAEIAVDLSDFLSQIRVPTLVMHRRDDQLMPFEIARELASRIPGAHLVSLPGRAHIIEVEYTQEFADELRAFVRAPARRGIATESTSDSDKAYQADGLSERETEVLKLIAAGMTNQEIADRLSLSVHTVERHISNLYRKLGIRSRSEATAYTFRRT